MAERLRSTGRKSKRALLLGGEAARVRHGTTSMTTSQARAALAEAAKNVAFHPADRAMRSAQEKESAPETPILAACPAVARDMSFPCTLSARSFRPVM